MGNTKTVHLVESQFESFFKWNNHPSIEKRLKKAQDLVGVHSLKLYYSKSGRLYKSRWYLKNSMDLLGGEVDGFLKQVEDWRK